MLGVLSVDWLPRSGPGLSIGSCLARPPGLLRHPRRRSHVFLARNEAPSPADLCPYDLRALGWGSLLSCIGRLGLPRAVREAVDLLGFSLATKPVRCQVWILLGWGSLFGQYGQGILPARWFRAGAADVRERGCVFIEESRNVPPMPAPNANAYRSVRGGKRCRTCPVCYAAAYVTKDGKWYRHRKPGMSLGYGMPNYAGPICEASGTSANP